MKKIFVFNLLAIMAFTACQTKEMEEPIQEDSTVFTAMIEDGFSLDTKTSLDGSGNVLWKQGDQVSIFAGSTINERYQVTDASDGKTAAALNKVGGSGFVAGTDIDNNVAFYPYASAAEIAKSGSNYVISEIELPATQTYAAGSFGNGAFPMAAVTSSTSDYNLKFKNVLGGLKLQLKGTATITSITVTGNNDEILCGDAEVTVAYGGVPSITLSNASAKTVTLDCGAGVTLDSETATSFIIALPPMTMTGGFTVVVTDSESKQMEIKTTKSQTIPRSNLLKMPVVNYVGAAKEYEYTITTDTGGTKASFTGSDFVWNTGDKVFLSDGSNSALCTIAAAYDGLTTAVVKTTQVLTGTVHCIYPGDAVTQSGETFFVDTPENQGTNGSAYMVYYGCSDSGPISMSAQTALMKIHLQSDVDDLASVKITFDGAPIVGRLQINGLGTSVLSGAQTAQVYENGDNDFYFSVLPGSITKMDIDIRKTDGSYGRKTSPSSLTISGGTAYNFSINPATLNFVDAVSPLKFTSTGSTIITLTKQGSPDEITLEYKVDNGEWTSYTIGNAVSLTDGQELSFRAGTSGNITFSQSSSDYYCFSTTGTGSGTVAASGNIMSILSKEECFTIPSDYCFFNLFYNCYKLTAAPELPATTLTDFCYSCMFSSCNSLTTAPDLPATTLAEGCYSYMFSSCNNLTTAPTLPATTMTESCYDRMFYGCTRLTTAPDLPATTLATNCYASMFHGCTRLTSAPDLPATTLATNCYASMFHGCTSLTTAPTTLPATTLTSRCYNAMFYGCTSLTAAPDLPATTLADNCYSSMFFGCTSLTTAPDLPATSLDEGCYEGMFSGCVHLTTAPTLPATVLASSCYKSMFYGCTSLTTAPDLPVTSLVSYCYSSMFSGCTGLTTAPDLPATTLASSCYDSMFYGCTSLTTAPDLPATSLVSYCYASMFRGCTSLTTAPDLPATTLMSYCYQRMFYGCTGLTTAPDLPATTLADYCYQYMFNGCTNLTTAPTALPATTLTNSCYYSMFYGCTSLTTAPTLPATTLTNSCYYRMFSGCTRLSYIKALFTTTPSTSYTNYWLYDVSATGTFIKSSSASWDVTGYNGVPSGWTVLTE